VAPRSTRVQRQVSQAKQDKSEISPLTTGKGNEEEGYDQTPMSEWRVSDDEEDSVPISQLLGANKEKVRGHRKDNSEWGKRMEKELGQIERRQQAKEVGKNPTGRRRCEV
jgi:hypothetical protein